MMKSGWKRQEVTLDSRLHVVVGLAGCKATETDVFTRKVKIRYDFVDGVIPGYVLVKPKKGELQLWYADENGISFSGPVEKEMAALAMDVSTGAIMQDGEQPLDVKIEKLPYLYRWLISSRDAEDDPIGSLFLSLYGEFMPADLRASQLNKMLMMMDRAGQLREQQLLWYEYAKLASAPLQQNVIKYEAGNRPSDMFTLTKIPGQEAAADRVLERNLKALGYLGMIDQMFDALRMPEPLKVLAKK